MDPTAFFALFDPTGGHLESWAFEGGYTQAATAVSGARLFASGQMSFDPTAIAGIPLELPPTELGAAVLIGFPPLR